MEVSIIGSGLVGRVMALTLLNNYPAVKINLFDKAENLYDKSSCGYMAAGMVSPYCELADVGEIELYRQGLKSLSLWSALLGQMVTENNIFKQNGTIVLSHMNDESDYNYFNQKLNSILLGVHEGGYQVHKNILSDLETNFCSNAFHSNILKFTEEGCVNVPMFYSETSRFLHEHTAVNYYQRTFEYLSEDELKQDDLLSSDWIIDSRGLGAKKSFLGLRGVRGEAIIVSAPEVNLSHTIRLIHPKYPLYIVPRGNNIYYIGATTIESEDDSPISLKSTMELLSALYVVHPGFSEARILKTIAHSRPTLSTGYPEVRCKDKLIQINGLNRHGYLLSPAICHEVFLKIKNSKNKVIGEQNECFI